MQSTPPAPDEKGRNLAKNISFRPGLQDLSRADLEQLIRELEDEVSDLHIELERTEGRVEAMKQIQRTLGSDLDPEILLEELVRRTTALIGADRSTLFLIDDETGEIVSQVIEANDIMEIRMPPGVGLAGWVAQSGEHVNIRDAYDDERFNPEVDRETGYRTRCMLVWPIRRPRGDEDVIGAIQVLNKIQGYFDAHDERLLDSIASSIGVAVEVMTLYRAVIDHNEAVERARDKLELLFETERAIGETSGLEAMLDVVLDTALTRLDARSGVVYLLDPQRDELRVEASAGACRISLGRMRPSLADPVLAAVVRDGEPYVALANPGVKRGRAKVGGLIAAPLLDRRGETIGALELINHRTNPSFNPEDLKVLTVVAGQAGRAIAAARERGERERADRLAAMGRMLSGVVHDLRTPMTLITGHSELMADSDDADERAIHARAVQKQIGVMTAMTKELLGFARGEVSVLLRKVYVGRFLGEIQQHLVQELSGSGIEVTVDVGYKGAARFDERKLRRVIHNIARNAQEAMPGGGCFSLSVSREDDDLVFQMADDGPGIPPELEGRLFEAFSTSGKAGGTGLGLAMVKKFADEHRGSVSYESAPGEGTRFFVRIPAGV